MTQTQRTTPVPHPAVARIAEAAIQQVGELNPEADTPLAQYPDAHERLAMLVRALVKEAHFEAGAETRLPEMLFHLRTAAADLQHAIGEVEQARAERELNVDGAGS